MEGYFIVILIALFIIGLILLIQKKKFEIFDIYAIIIFALQMFSTFLVLEDVELEYIFDIEYATIGSFAYCIGYYSFSIISIIMLYHSLLSNKRKSNFSHNNISEIKSSVTNIAENSINIPDHNLKADIKIQYCPYCGTPIRENAQYCYHCGKMINN